MDDLSELDRRSFLKLGGAVAVSAGSAKALDNTVLGYGKNLKSQDLDGAMTAHMRPRPFSVEHEDVEIWSDYVRVGVDVDGETAGSVWPGDLDGAREIEDEVGVDGPVVELAREREVLSEGEFDVEFHDYEEFFDLLDDAETLPWAVETVRGHYRDVEPETVEEFAADPRDVRDTVYGLRDAFRRRGHYDIPRYLAGAVEDNLLFGKVDLRRYFEDDVSFEGLMEEPAGMFCWEYNERVGEALHSVAAHEQEPPVAVVYILDTRHKHAFAGLVSAFRRDDRLVYPTTFVDYTYSTLYSDLHVTSLFKEGLDGYTSRHRADRIYWSSPS